MRPAPHDFAAVARVSSLAALMSRYGASKKTLARWIADECPDRQDIPRGGQRLEMPADFAARAAEMTDQELMVHFDRGYHTIRRWRVESAAPRPPRPASVARAERALVGDDSPVVTSSDRLLRRQLETGLHWITDPARFAATCASVGLAA